ncbi:MAG: hypothetical protein IJN86_01695 [Clostridia bacterium]|nr:hypothetical protein [Clostridia bacterium]
MKSNGLIVLLVIALAMVICFAVWAFSGYDDSTDKHSDESSDDIGEHSEALSFEDEKQTISAEETSEVTKPEISESSEDVAAEESSTVTEEPHREFLLDKYKNTLDEGIYKLTITKQRQVGGLSLPVVTRIWVGDGYISITEAETHNISTEIFINNDGAYFLNTSDNTAQLLPTNAVEITKISLDHLAFLEEGSVNISSVTYSYERYKNADGEIADFLFSDGELKKVKRYKSGDEYELVGLEISDDISDGRNTLPDNLIITDKR